jgi:2-methylisocitrate lyase-like PEP mutase family enzyme
MGGSRVSSGAGDVRAPPGAGRGPAAGLSRILVAYYGRGPVWRMEPRTGDPAGAGPSARDRIFRGSDQVTPFPQRQVSPTASRRRLRELLAGPLPLELPGPYDGASAQVLAKIGFEALWAGGKVSSQARLGAPDVNLMTMTEQLEFCTSIVDATGLPIVADADDGYGQALMVTRTVQAFERAGVAAIVIEDQASPKHCAFYEGMPLDLISTEQHVAKIKAAVDARHDETLMIWARTDALPAGLGTSEALDRAHACVEAGADAVFTPSSSLDDLATIGHAWDRPEHLVMSSYNFVDLELTKVKEIGYSLRLHPMPAILAALRAVENVYRELYTTGSFGQATKSSMPLSELVAMTGKAEADALDARFRAISEAPVPVG